MAQTRDFFRSACIIVIALLLSACGGSGGGGGGGANNPPTITGTPAVSVTQGTAYSFIPTANDPDGNPLSFTITNPPAWAGFNAQTGELSGTPGVTNVGNYPGIVISVTDGTDSASLPGFAIQVTAVTLHVDAGADQTIALPDDLTLDATVTENGLPPQGQMTYSWSQTSGPGTIIFTSPDAEDTTATVSEVGSYRVSLTADNGSQIVSDSVEITVNLKAAGSSGMTGRPANASECIAPATPPVASNIILENPYPNLPGLTSPLAMYMAPGVDSHWYVVQQTGQVRRFANNPSVSSLSTFIDIDDDRLVDGGERGLLGMAFHPDYATNGYVYLSYTSPGLVSRISRFQLDGTGQALDPASEQIILSLAQPYSNHNGGQIAFSPTDGNRLYIGFGDGGSGGDPDGHGQNTNTLLGAMLRIDVGDGSSGSYTIPTDNPFASGGGAPEIFAWGLRNPWRWSFDRTTGDLWVGDVGQGEYEEIDIVTRGNNYGWNIMEGLHCYRPSSNCDQSGLTLPVAEYNHSQGRSVTGGYRYRGSEIGFLQGQYLYGDYVSGRIWGLQETTPDQYTSTELLDTSLNIASFAEDHAGELYIIHLGGGIRKIVGDTGGQGGQVPSQLSGWGCFQSTDTSAFSDSVIPYDMNTMLWTDHADKGRFMAIPDGTTIDVDAEGRFDYPVGSVVGKHFWLNNQIVETRLMLHHEQPHGWRGYSYEWNDQETDATLLSSSKLSDLGNQTTWYYPSPAECDACHTAVSGFTVGPEVGQLNRSYLYPSTGLNANQLITLETIGVMSSNFSEQQKSTAFYAIDDTAYSAERRARSYLHSNCAYCHQPGGPGGGDMDLRMSAMLDEMQVCNEAPLGDTLGMTNPVIIAPGDPDNSILVRRMEDLGQYRMPPLGTAEVDIPAMIVIRNWIRNLAGCS